MRRVQVLEGPLQGESRTLLHALVLDDDAYEFIEQMRSALTAIRDASADASKAQLQAIARAALSPQPVSVHAWDVLRNKNGA